MDPQRDRPNILVFFTDQQRWDTSGLHGNPLGLTPNLDRMASEGTHISRCFTCQPVCGPARSCMQTGRYATDTGCFRNGIPLANSEKTLGHYFSDAGYQTAYIGKWHLASEEPVPLEDRAGYQYWLASNILEFTSSPYRTTLYDNGGNPVVLPGYRADAVVDAAIRYVTRPRGDRPFFLFVSLVEPHHQNQIDDYPAPDGYREQYAGRWVPPDLAALGGSTHQHLAGYYGMVKRVDEALGRLLDALKSRDLLDTTVLLFTSDHGCHFKTRNSEYKRSCHESSIRIPCVMRGPGFAGRGRVEHLVSLIDLPPTLLEAAGIPIPEKMQGRSLLSLFNQKGSWPEEVFVQVSETQVGRAIRTDQWKYGVVAPDKDGLRDSWANRYHETYLYDIHADPYELRNLVGRKSSGAVSEELRRRLRVRIAEAGEPPATIVPTFASGACYSAGECLDCLGNI